MVRQYPAGRPDPGDSGGDEGGGVIQHKKNKPMSKNLLIRISPNLKKRLKAAGEKTGKSFSEMTRIAIQDYIEFVQQISE